MVLTVGADSYVSITDADTYWSDRNNPTWSAATTVEKEAAIREATQYIDGYFSFIGQQKTDNVLAFPRHDVEIKSGNFAGLYYDSNTIPPQIEQACCELALQALSSRLDEAKDRGGLVKRVKVDVIETEYIDFAPSGKTYKFVANILKPLLSSTTGVKKLVRT